MDKRWTRAGGYASLALTLVLLLSTTVKAQHRSSEEQKLQELKRLEADLATTKAQQQKLQQQRKAVQIEIEQLRGQMIVAGRSASQNEKALSDLETALQALEADAANQRALIALRRSELIEVLATSQRLAQLPPVAILMRRGDPQDVIRAGLILGGMVPAVQERLQSLRVGLEDLVKLDDTIRRQRGRVLAQLQGMAQERSQIAILLKRKQALEEQLEDETGKSNVKLKQLAANAKDLREFLDRLIAERQTEERRQAEEAGRSAVRREQTAQQGDFGGAEITLSAGRTLPVAGRITGLYGQPTEAGGIARGLSIETRPAAVVLSPAAGRVIFSGPFRGYGLILIVEHRDGYHSLLAGLGRLDATVGRQVGLGEPVGIMTEGGVFTPILYFEIRRQGQTLNPQIWVSAQRTN